MATLAPIRRIPAAGGNAKRARLCELYRLAREHETKALAYRREAEEVVRDLYRDGESAAALGALIGVRPQRIYQILGWQTESAQDDPLYEAAKALVIAERRGSGTLLRRKLRIGVPRADRLLAFLERDGIVGPPNGVKARPVLVTASENRAVEDEHGHRNGDSVD